jgi:hypothetical protein
LGEGAAEEAAMGMRAASIEALLGVDFGTRFTKVAAYLPHLEERVVLTFGRRLGAFIPSGVTVATDNLVYPVDVQPAVPVAVWIDNLKMRLADPASDVFGSEINISGTQLKDSIRCLCAVFLSGVLRQAQVAVRRIFAQNLPPDAPISWFANVGVPAQFFDSGALSAFQEVASVAWTWSEAEPRAASLAELMADYTHTATSLGPREMPIRVAPELAAALAHFGEHRNTIPGLYGFFDIGGGTLDGTLFRVDRQANGVLFDVLSAQVDELGTMAIARRSAAQIFQDLNEFIEKPIIFGGPTPTAEVPIPKDIERSIQAFFSRVMDTARQKIPGQHFATQLDAPKLLRAGRKRSTRMPIIPIFVAGGGCQSEWYLNVLERTHQAFNHAGWGIGGYQIGLIPPPSGMKTSDYPRFVVAIGLTSPRVHSDDYRLPNGAIMPFRTAAASITEPAHEVTND